ncbi:MAG: hypothetical protein IJC83_05590 [Oscillospiraceae bacterium]|nr:hypothetical protein [Oscillospiraceae bacterium]
MKKRAISLCLAVLMLLLTLTGCGETSPSESLSEVSSSKIAEVSSSSSQDIDNSSSGQIVFRGIGVDKIAGWECTSLEYAMQTSPNSDMTVYFITNNLIFNETAQ